MYLLLDVVVRPLQGHLLQVMMCLISYQEKTHPQHHLALSLTTSYGHDFRTRDITLCTHLTS